MDVSFSIFLASCHSQQGLNKRLSQLCHKLTVIYERETDVDVHAYNIHAWTHFHMQQLQKCAPLSLETWHIFNCPPEVTQQAALPIKWCVLLFHSLRLSSSISHASVFCLNQYGLCTLVTPRVYDNSWRACIQLIAVLVYQELAEQRPERLRGLISDIYFWLCRTTIVRQTLSSGIHLVFNLLKSACWALSFYPSSNTVIKHKF